VYACLQHLRSLCEDLGVLKGDSSLGVTDTYLAKGTTRDQAAILYLRLIGKEDEAYAFEGEDNFADADQTWDNAKRALAYLKANPDLGWQGVSPDKFDPKAQISAQQMYKVCLEALGYKQGVDFEWADVFTFAEDKGLTLIADVTEMTNNDVAIALVEALKLPLKDSDTTLAADLVAKGVITEAAAIDAGLVAAEPDAAVTAVSAIDATTIKVSFDKAVAANAADYKVTDSASKDMAVASAASADAGLTVILKVAEMTVGSKYTVTYGTTSFDVVATTKNDETKPALAKAEAVTGTLVRATFETRNINKDTLVAANFTLDNDAKVNGLKLDTAKMDETGQENNTVVLLDVTGLKAGKAFKLTSKSVASYEGAVASTSEATFAGKDPDTTAPKISYAKSVAGYQVELKFDEEGIVNDSALDISNYTITPALEITAAAWKKNELGNNIVILTTAPQKSGTAYEISVNNISDGTNVMTSAAKFTFAGQDKATNQELVSAIAKNANRVEVTFKYDCNDTALDIANYTIDNGITVTAAAFKEDTSEVDKLNQKIVVLTTSAMKAGTAYKITVGTGVQDTLGQGLKEAASFTFAGQDPDTSFGSVSAESDGKNKVKVTFSEEVDRASATALVNYSISDLGYPSAISLDSTNKIATLTVSTQTAGKSYTITLNNIKDLAGNVITANTKVTFTGKGDVVSDVRVVSAVALSKNKIKVTFNQKLLDTVAGAAPSYTLTLSDGTAIQGLTVTGATIGNAAGAQTDTNIVTVGGVDLSDTKVYKLTVTSLNTVKGYLTNHTLNTDYDEAIFVGSSANQVEFGIASIIPLDKTHIKVTFDMALKAGETALPTTSMNIYSDSSYSTAAKDASGAVIQNGTYDNAITPGSVPAAPVFSGDRKVVTYTLAKELQDSTVYYFQLDGLGNFDSDDGVLKPYETGSTKARATFVTGTLSAAADNKLEIKSVAMFDKNTIEVEFNNDYVATAVNAPSGGTAPVADSGAALDASDIVIATSKDGSMISGVSVTKIQKSGDNKIKVYISGEDKMTETSGIYYLRINGATATGFVTKITGQGFKADKNYASFAKNNPDNAKVTVSMVEPLTPTLLKVTLSEKAFANVNETAIDKTNFVIKKAGVNVAIADTDKKAIVHATGEDANKVFYVELQNGVFLAGASYRIGLTGVVDESGLAANNYVPTSDDYSMQFGGTGSARDSFSITGNLVSGTAQDGVTFTDNTTATADTIAFAAGSFLAGDTVTIKIGTASPISLSVNGDGSVTATGIGDNTGVASVSALLTIVDAAGNTFTQTITLAGTGATLN